MPYALIDPDRRRRPYLGLKGGTGQWGSRAVECEVGYRKVGSKWPWVFSEKI